MSENRYSLTIVRNPFNARIRDIHTRNVGEPVTVPSGEWAASINGRVVPVEHIRPGAGDHVVLCPVLRGGGGGGGKNPIAIIGALALTIATVGILGAPAAAALLGGKGVWLAVGAVLFLGGSLLTGKPKVDTPNVASTSAWENGYEWGEMRPLSTQGGCVPLTYGVVRTTGTIVGQHVSGDGKHQYLNLLLCGGEGPIDSITSIEINKNPLANFSGTTEETTTVVSGGTLATDYTEVEASAGSVGLTARIQFPQGLYGANPSIAAVAVFIIEYSADGIAWTGWINEGVTAGQSAAFTKSYTKSGLAAGTWKVRAKLTTVPAQPVIIESLVCTTASGDVTAETRLGTNDQAIIPFFSDTYADQFVQLELNTSTFSSWNTEGDGGEGLEITISFPQGLSYVADDGSAAETWVKLTVDYQIVGDTPWTSWLAAEEIRGAENKPIRRTFRLDDLTAGQYTVRCKLDSVAGTTNRYLNQTVWTQLTHIVYDDFIRPGKVLVGLRAIATDKLSGGMPSVSWLQTRATVLVYDPDAAAYVEKAATNPAWICYDLIHRARTLHDVVADEDVVVVGGEAHTNIDFDAFDAWADWCDELVDGEARCSVNVLIDSAKGLWEQLQTVAQMGRGLIAVRGTTLTAIYDGSEDTPVQMFNVANIGIDSFTGEYLNSRDRADAVEISFINSAKGYQRDTVIVYGDTFDASVNVANPTQLFLPGITDYKRAYREGLYRLRLNKYVKRSVAFLADIDSLACQVGDVILIQHDIPRWGWGGRIVSATASVLTLDKEVTLDETKAYQVRVRLANDTLVTRTVYAAFRPVDPVLVGDALDPWTQTGAKAGSGVALNSDGSVMAIGSPGYDVGVSGRGVVEILDRSGETWARRGDLIPHPVTNSTGFGYGLAMTPDGSTLIIGAMNHTSTARNRGAVYTYDRDGTGWVQRGSVLLAPDAGDGDQFGRAVAISEDGSVLVVGAGFWDGPGGTNQGAVYTYDRDGTGWVQRGSVLTASDAGDTDIFGYGVGLSGDGLVLVVGAYGWDGPVNVNQGAVYTYDWSGTEWVQRGDLITYAQKDAWLGFSVVIHPEKRVLLVGAANMDSNGAAVLYDLVGTGWVQRGDPFAIPSPSTQTQYAGSVALSSDYQYAAIGAPQAPNSSSKYGRVAFIRVADISGGPTEVLVTPAFDPVPAKYDLWALGETAVETKPFRVNKISRARDLKAKIEATEYYAEVYDETATVPDLDYTISLPTVRNLQLGFYFNIAGAAFLTIAWTPPRGSYSGAVVMINGVLVARANSAQTEVEHQVYEDKAYIVEVIGLDQFGNSLGSVQGSYVLTALSIPLFTGAYKPVIAENTYILTDGTVLTDIDVTLVVPAYTFFKTTNIYYQVDGAGEWIKAGDTNTTTFIIKALRELRGKVIQVKCNMVNRWNVEGGPGLSDTLALVGKSTPPANVTGFQATQDGGMIDLSWDHVADADLWGYEIREGLFWDEALPVAVGVQQSDYSIPISEERAHTFWIKAIDNSDIFSTAATKAVITPIILLPKNVILTYDDIALKDGSHDQTAFSASGYKFNTVPGKWSDYPGEKWSDFPSMVLTLAEESAGVYYASGSYTTVVRDFLGVLNVQIVPRVAATVPSGTYRLKLRTSIDNVTWTDWVDAVPQTVTARYIQGRMDLTTDDTSLTPAVRVLSWVVDVPDIDRAGAGATVGVGGTALTFGYTFYAAPAVIASAMGGNRKAEITATSTTGFTVRVVDETGTDVGGTVDWHAKGY